MFLNLISIYISVTNAVQAVPMKRLMVSGDDSAKKGTQLSLTEESHINKAESEKQLRFRYSHLFLPNMLLLAGLNANLKSLYAVRFYIYNGSSHFA